MDESNRVNEKRNTRVRNSSSIIFNLVALALLLTVIVLLHQMLKKPVESQTTAIKAIPAIPTENTQAPETLPGTPTENTATAPAPAATAPAPAAAAAAPAPAAAVPAPASAAAPAAAEVPIPAPNPTAIAQESQAAPVVSNNAKDIKRTASQYDMGPEELDTEQARQQYLQENGRALPTAGKQNTASSSSAPSNVQAREEPQQGSPRLVSNSRAPVVAPSRLDLDDTAARQYYIEQNRQLSPGALKKEGLATTQERSGEQVSQPYEQKNHPVASNPSPSRLAPSTHDLDDENARTHYLEQNRELSPDLAHGNTQTSTSSAR